MTTLAVYGDLKAVGLEMIRRNLSGSCLVHRQLGVGMDERTRPGNPKF